MASRTGNSYTNSHFSGNSRVHQGNVYNQYGSSPDEKAVGSVLESLSYEGMNDRKDRLKDAQRGTFDWALAEGEVEVVTDRTGYRGNYHTRTKTIDVSFTRWLEGEPGGLFCFMGKPGSGKSTLMYVNREMIQWIWTLLTWLDGVESTWKQTEKWTKLWTNGQVAKA